MFAKCLMVRTCSKCQLQRAVLRRPKTNEQASLLASLGTCLKFFLQLCRSCFFCAFEDEVHQTISSCNLFKRGERIAIGASGGKDSTVLAHTLSLLNQRHKCSCPAVDCLLTWTAAMDWNSFCCRLMKELLDTEMTLWRLLKETRSSMVYHSRLFPTRISMVGRWMKL